MLSVFLIEIMEDKMKKTISGIVKNLIKECANIDYNTLADALKISVPSFRNKIS